jgi:hypothetical protein
MPKLTQKQIIEIEFNIQKEEVKRIVKNGIIKNGIIIHPENRWIMIPTKAGYNTCFNGIRIVSFITNKLGLKS